MTADNHTKSKKAHLVSLKHKLKGHLSIKLCGGTTCDNQASVALQYQIIHSNKMLGKGGS